MSRSYSYAFPRRGTHESVRQSGDETLTCSTQCGWCKGISRGYVIKALQSVTSHSMKLEKSSFTISAGFLDSPIEQCENSGDKGLVKYEANRCFVAVAERHVMGIETLIPISSLKLLVVILSIVSTQQSWQPKLSLHRT